MPSGCIAAAASASGSHSCSQSCWPPPNGAIGRSWPSSLPADYLLDNVEFYQEPYPENDVQVRNISSTYVAASNELIVTWCAGFSSSRPCLVPIVNVPAGMRIISTPLLVVTTCGFHSIDTESLLRLQPKSGSASNKKTIATDETRMEHG